MLSFHTTTESGRSVSVPDIPDLGVQGKGSVRPDFLMHPFWESARPEIVHVSIYAKLSGTSDFQNKYVVFHPVGIEITR